MDEKEERGNYVRVGALIFTGLALLAFVIFSIGNTTHPFQTIYKLETRFTRVNGLQKGAPVTLSGVTIGTVESIDFPKDRKATYVIVRMKIEGSATERIRADSVVNIRTMGLLGDKFIDISPGSQTAPIAPANYVLRSKDPIDYEAILGGKGTGDFLSNIMQASDSMSRILADIDRGNGLLSQLIHGERQGREANELLESIQHLNATSAELQQIVHRVNVGQGLLGSITSDNARGRQLFDNLSQTSFKLRDVSDRLDRITQRFENPQGLLPRLMTDRWSADKVLDNMVRSSFELHSILYKVDTGQGTLGKLVNDPDLYNQTRNLVGGGSVGFSVLRGLFKVTHPLDGSDGKASQPNQPTSYAPAPAQPAPAYTQPRSATQPQQYPNSAGGYDRQQRPSSSARPPASYDHQRQSTPPR